MSFGIIFIMCLELLQLRHGRLLKVYIKTDQQRERISPLVHYIKPAISEETQMKIQGIAD